MSKKNIISQKEVGKKLHVTFQNDDGTRTYEFGGTTKRAFLKGTDPNDLTGGRLLKFEKKRD